MAAKRRYSPVGRTIDTYRDFRAFDELNRQFWRRRYLERTGRTNARGWQLSGEFLRYEQNRESRIDKLIANNPDAYIQNAQYIERKAEIDRDEIEEMAVFNSLSELTSLLDFYLFQAYELRKRLYTRVMIDGRYYIGRRAIEQAIMNITKEWRDRQREIEKELRRIEKETGRKQKSPTPMKLYGEAKIIEGRTRIVFDGKFETEWTY